MDNVVQKVVWVMVYMVGWSETNGNTTTLKHPPVQIQNSCAEMRNHDVLFIVRQRQTKVRLVQLDGQRIEHDLVILVMNDEPALKCAA
jgi:hypothetical protein